MKIRTDFVSNSSSSSFIIQDTIHFFDLFHISHKDILDTLKKLIGEDINKPTNKVFVYDMTDKSIQQSIYDEYSYMKDWVPSQQVGYDCWKAIDIIKTECGIDDSGNIIRKRTTIPVPGFRSLVSFVIATMEIKTMWDFLRDEDTTHLIHFDDNEINHLKGFGEMGRPNTLSKYEIIDNPNIIQESKRSPYRTDHCSDERFFEVLFMELEKRFSIDYKNEELLRRLMNHANWMKKDSNVDWYDLLSFISFQAILHEG